jgi:hypothetical protein
MIRCTMAGHRKKYDSEFSGVVSKVSRINDTGTYFTTSENDGERTRNRSFPARLDLVAIVGELVTSQVRAISSTGQPHETLLYTLTVLSGKYKGLVYEHKLR